MEVGWLSVSMTEGWKDPQALFIGELISPRDLILLLVNVSCNFCLRLELRIILGLHWFGFSVHLILMDIHGLRDLHLI